MATGTRKTANIVVISPTPSHPQDAGNRARIFALLSELKRSGYKIFFIFLEKKGTQSNIEAMGREWDGFWRVEYQPPPTRIAKTLFDAAARLFKMNCVLPYKIDDWFDSATQPYILNILVGLDPDVVLVEYVFISKILDLFGNDVLRILDTHDVFTERDKLFLAQKRRPGWFYTSREEENKGLDRADIILAIQKCEAEYFSTLTRKKVLTVGHHVGPTMAIRSGQSIPNRLLFVGSRALSNLDGIKWFCDNVMGGLQEKIPDISLDIVGTVGDYIDKPPEGVSCIGAVTELARYYHQCTVVINPVRFGTGLKIKTIEALAMSRPLITTPAGAAGIEEWAGRAFLCAERAQEFADAVLTILKSRTLQDSLSRGAHDFSVWYRRRAIAPLIEEIEKHICSDNSS